MIAKPTPSAVGLAVMTAADQAAARAAIGASTVGILYADQNGVTPDGTDKTTALSSLLATAYTLGGAEIRFGPGVYRFDGQITLPNNGSTTATQGVPIRFTGVGEWWSGKGVPSANPANGGTIFDCRYTGADAWLMCLHEGTFSSKHITFSQRGVSAHTTPYIKTTNTTLQIDQCSFEGHASKAAATANQDCIILGGTNNASFGGNNVDAPFQGYGTVISRSNFNRIRRGVYGRVYCNGVVVRDNQFWAQCGDSGIGAGAIEFDSGTTDYCVGGLISGNLIECVGYTKPIKLVRGSQITLLANSFYDQPGATTGLVNLTLCNNIGIVGGAFNDVRGPYVNDTSQCSFALIAGVTTAVQMQFVYAGRAGYPNKLPFTTFSGGTNALNVQPDAALGTATGIQLEIKRSAAESTDPGATIWGFRYDGSLTLGNPSATQQGNITTSLPAATSWSNNGRKWACNSTGGNMETNSGTGGSVMTHKHYAQEFRDHSGTLQGKWGAGKMGFAYGPSLDATWERHASVPMMISAQPIRAGEYTVSTLPPASVNYRGARAYVTDSAAVPTFGSLAMGGGSSVTGVFCTGTTWIYG